MSEKCWVLPNELALGSTSPVSQNSIQVHSRAMIDKFAFRRKVMVLEHCLTLARAYHDQDKPTKSQYYTLLASEYFGEIVGLLEREKPSVVENKGKAERVGLLG